MQKMYSQLLPIVEYFQSWFVIYPFLFLVWMPSHCMIFQTNYQTIFGYEMCEGTFYIICIFLILSHLEIMKIMQMNDPLCMPYLFGWTGWQWSHLIFYALLGYIFPMSYLKLIIIGIEWEAFEIFIGKYFKFNSLKVITDRDCWWVGCYSDVLFNTAGLTIGTIGRISNEL